MAATSNQATAYLEMSGRIFFDMMRIVQSGHALRSYTLQNVCREFLKYGRGPKQRIHTSLKACRTPQELLDDDTFAGLFVSALQTAGGGGGSSSSSNAQRPKAGTQPGLGRVQRYALRQAELPLLLMDRLMTLVQTVEVARATGLNMRHVWTRGQMIRTWSLLLRQTREWG